MRTAESTDLDAVLARTDDHLGDDGAGVPAAGDTEDDG